MAKVWMHCCKDCGVLISKKFEYCTKHNGSKYTKPIKEKNRLFKEKEYRSKYKNSEVKNRIERGCRLDD